jgi:hypothetical protein
MAFVDRIYMSEDSYYLEPALEIPLKSVWAPVRNFGVETFYHLMGSMGFTSSETYELVDSWEIGMNFKPRDRAKLIADGLGHHSMSIIGLERYRKGAFHQMFKDFGIANAERYYDRGLRYQFQFKDDSTLPYVQQIMAAYDHNESQLNSSAMCNFATDISRFDYESKTARATVRVIEVKNHEDLVSRK